MTTTTERLRDRPALGSAVRRLTLNQRTVLAAIAVVLFLGFGALNPQFFNGPFVVLPLLSTASIFVVVGLAQMCVLSIGQMNLAVGRMAAVGAMAAGAAYQYAQLPWWLGVVLAVAVGGAVGALAGGIIVRTGVNAFVVTLALDFVLLGFVTLVYSALTDTGAFGAMPAELRFVGDASFLDVCAAGYCGPASIPVLVVPALIGAVLIHHLYARARLGRELLATGANFRAAELTGIPAGRRVVLAHTLSGALAGLAGVLLAASIGSFSAAIGSEFMIPSFLGPVLGGTLLAGGFVSVLGTVIGTLITLIIRTGLTVAGAGLETLNIALGAVLLLALSAQRLQGIRRRKKEVRR